MKISTINYIKPNFKGQLSSQSLTPHHEFFVKLLNGAAITDEDSVKEELQGSVKKPDIAVIYPANIDLSVKIQKAKKALPFSMSDKKLVLDEYQEAAIELFRDGKNVMVTAPTGTGKTLIAEHAINDVVNSGKRVIYTTPLKALCNDKYKQFSALWGDYDKDGNLIGSSRVGLATGDVKINTKAPIVIMTTEVYRNMLTQHGQKDVEKELKNVGAVIFDEFHFMGDSQRGSVWEEALMFSPPKIRHMMLSATIANANPIINWLNSINGENSSVVVNVPEEERHVPLKYLTYSNLGSKMGLYDLLSDKISVKDLRAKNLSLREKEVVSNIGKLMNDTDGLRVLEQSFSDVFCDFGSTGYLKDFVERLTAYGVPRLKAEQYGLRLVNKKLRAINPALSKIQPITQVPVDELVKDIEKRKMTPVLYFVYSKRNCKNYMKDTSEKVGQLLTDAEKKEIQRRIDEVNKKGIFLGVDFEKDIKPCLLNGFAMHHSGMLPQCKSFIEELGRNKLIKVCFATDTLGAGINFPFKTVIFSSFEKYSEDGFVEISTNSFKQGAGRAGRRGIDDVGYVISIPKDKDEVFVPFDKIVQESDDVQSAFKLSYGLILSPRFLNQPMNVLSKSFDNFQRQSYDENLKKSHLMKDILRKKHFIETKGDITRLTPKGKIASKIRGINEILISEILTDNTISENITPSELATIISIFSPEREDNTSIPNFNDEKLKAKTQKAIDLAEEIKNMEIERGIDSDININSRIMPYIKMWADTSETADNSVLWTNIIEMMVSNNVIRDEGDFFKKINYTTNILKQIQKAAPTSYLRETAEKAVKKLQKSPVNDILLYELDNSVVHE